MEGGGGVEGRGLSWPWIKKSRGGPGPGHGATENIYTAEPLEPGAAAPPPPSSPQGPRWRAGVRELGVGGGWGRVGGSRSAENPSCSPPALSGQVSLRTPPPKKKKSRKLPGGPGTVSGAEREGGCIGGYPTNVLPQWLDCIEEASSTTEPC